MNNIIKLDFEKAATEHKPDPIQRMKAAVAEMAAENTKFQDSMVEFKGIMEELGRRMEKLGNSCRDFQRSLERINVKPIRRKSLRLAGVMDDCFEGQSVNAA